ncbi:S41 family peptidase [Cellvibrio sp. NN19]|uniref:S41 family peptidase n=1 Tax=Cellvibrio chitinivorans TaxID=3102792 RepID=UPI002B406AB7|nr:S41 family peptidase [Cellvibrio sp. NN19]
MIKNIFTAFFVAIVLLLITAAIVYAAYLTPQKRAAAHLEYIHTSISEMHPAMLEPNATAFHSWHKDGFQKAKGLLAQVNSQADEIALINFYLAGYQDAHLSGHLDHIPYQSLDLRKDIWTGWLLKATNKGYFVTYSKNGEAYPPEKSHLISCDNTEIDVLLHEHYAPYIDNRWHILKTRDSAAKALTQDRATIGVLNRPALKQCTFEINGAVKTYPITWLAISEDDASTISSHYQYPYHLPSLFQPAPDTVWIRARDFGLYTQEAVKSQQQLLHDISAASKENSLIIVDVRGNSGGNSINGTDIISAIFNYDEKAKEYVFNEYNYRLQGAQPIYRASWQLYWSYDYSYKKIIANHGKESEYAQYMEKFLVRLKKALDAGEQSLPQNETPIEYNSGDAPTDEWKSTKKLLLITDKTCVSACLDFVDLIKLLPNTLHLGEPTEADTAYTEIAFMQSEYAREKFNFLVPVKKWNKRMRKDNQPYTPDVTYEGDMSDDKALQQWALTQAKQYFGLTQ